MVKEERATPVVRLGRGEKANKKKMAATVAAVYTAEPRVRTPMRFSIVSSVPNSRLSPAAKNPSPHAKSRNKSVFGRVCAKSKDDIIQEVGGEMKRSRSKASQEACGVTDGERALQHRVIQHIAGVLSYS